MREQCVMLPHLYGSCMKIRIHVHGKQLLTKPIYIIVLPHLFFIIRSAN